MNIKTTHQQSEKETEEFSILADELEHEWRRSLPRYMEKGLVEIFAPPPDMIREKLEDWKRKQEEKTKDIKQALWYVYMAFDESSRWFGELIIKVFLLPDLEAGNKHVARLQRILSRLLPKRLTLINNEKTIEYARQYSIYEIAKYRLLLRGCGNKFSSLCPFHEEKHASFYIYPETNTFHCFGCQENGDIIKLTMHLYGISFREAVKMLQ